jgi:hypothetical protein
MATVRLALIVATIAGCSKPSVGPPDTSPVKAILYAMAVVEDPIHDRRGHWINELFLPDPGVVCNVVWKTDVSAKPGEALTWDNTTVAVSNAFFGSLEERRKGTIDVRPEYEWTQQEIEIPRDLANQIFALADLTRWEQQARKDVAASMCKTLGLELGGGRHPLPKDQ